MKSSVVVVHPGEKIRLRDIDPDDTGGLSKDEAEEKAEKLRDRFQDLQRALYAEHRQSLLIILQAMDTGGKDGAARHLLAGIDPVGIEITSFKPPSRDELDHDFLWRVHKCTPALGMIGLWNRSHYEDVLIARVQKLVPKDVWKERYEDMNAFERILVRNNTRILKFFLHISKDEQKKRLEARLEKPHKRWKFHPDDLKDRAFWDHYQEAYEDAINRCSTPHALWNIVPANAKWARNLAVMECVVNELGKMDPKYPKVTFDPKEIVIE